MLATVRPRDIAGKTRRRVAAEELADLVAVDEEVKKIKAELKAAVRERGSTLMDVHGIGPAGAARILADVGDVARFPDRNRFASWTGTAPLDASSGEQIRHRLSRAGNRRMNHVIHIAAIVQLRNDTEGRAYYRRKLAAGKTPLEALRCLKRRLSDVVYRRLVADARASEVRTGGTGPGGHCGASLQSSAVDLPPHIDTSDQPLPGPADPTLQPAAQVRKSPREKVPQRLLDTEGSQMRAHASVCHWPLKGCPPARPVGAPERSSLAVMPPNRFVRWDSRGGHRPATYCPRRPVWLRYTPKRTARSLRVNPRRPAIIQVAS